MLLIKSMHFGRKDNYHLCEEHSTHKTMFRVVELIKVAKTILSHSWLMVPWLYLVWDICGDIVFFFFFLNNMFFSISKSLQTTFSENDSREKPCTAGLCRVSLLAIAHFSFLYIIDMAFQYFTFHTGHTTLHGPWAGRGKAIWSHSWLMVSWMHPVWTICRDSAFLYQQHIPACQPYHQGMCVRRGTVI